VLKGRRAESPGYIYRWLDFNKFEDFSIAVPVGAVEDTTIHNKYIQEYFYDETKTHLTKLLILNPQDIIYPIHDNGDRPFVVVVSKSGRVSIYKKPRGYIWRENWSENFSENIAYYSELVKAIDDPLHTMIGLDSSHIQDGNSVLIQMCDNCRDKVYEVYKGLFALPLYDGTILNVVLQYLPPQYTYMYIGSMIYTFTTAYQITNYYSTMGNSNVPYPVAVSKDHVFFMLDLVYLERKLFPHVRYFDNAYSHFYALRFSLPAPKFENVQIIHERID